LGKRLFDVQAQVELSLTPDVRTPSCVQEMSSQTRKVWLSKVDVRALLGARDVFDLLARRYPAEEAMIKAYSVLRGNRFRRRVHDMFDKAGEASRDHVLVEIPRDMYLVLKAMGLCGLRDTRGRRICLPPPGGGGSKTTPWLTLYAVLLQQFLILFGFKDDMNWALDEHVFAVAHYLFEGAIPRVAASSAGVLQKLSDKWYLRAKSPVVWSLEDALQKLFRATFDLKTPPAGGAKLNVFIQCAVELERVLDDLLDWWLHKKSPQKLPDNGTLREFRKRYNCAVVGEPSSQCQRSVAQHVRLFRARITESVLMESLAMIPSEVAKDVEPLLQRQINATVPPSRATFQPRVGSDLSTLRLLWAEAPGAKKFAVYSRGSFANNDNRLAGDETLLRLLGLSQNAVWGGVGPRAHEKVHDSLTRETKKLSGLNPSFSLDDHDGHGTMLGGSFVNHGAPSQSKLAFAHAQSVVHHAPLGAEVEHEPCHMVCASAGHPPLQ